MEKTKDEWRTYKIEAMQIGDARNKLKCYPKRLLGELLDLLPQDQIERFETVIFPNWKASNDAEKIRASIDLIERSIIQFKKEREKEGSLYKISDNPLDQASHL